MQTSVTHKEAHAGELPRLAERPGLSGSRSWLWLAGATGLLLISSGANNVPLAAWLAPLFLLRFVRGLLPPGICTVAPPMATAV